MLEIATMLKLLEDTVLLVKRPRHREFVGVSLREGCFIICAVTSCNQLTTRTMDCVDLTARRTMDVIVELHSMSCYLLVLVLVSWGVV